MQNADNIQIVRPDVNGASWVGGESATVPTNATDALSGYKSEGWLAEDGITMTVNRETVDLRGFGGDVAVTIQSSHDVEFKYRPMEWNETVAKTMFGEDNVTSDANGVIVNGKTIPAQKRVFEMMGRNSERFRVVVPVMQFMSMGDFQFKHDTPMAAELTFKALPDASGNKVYIYKAVAE